VVVLENEDNHKSVDNVLTCLPASRLEEAVSNTRGYQSLLDVPPPPKILTTRIKTKLRHTQYAIAMYPTEVLFTRKRGNRTRGLPSPIVLMFPRCCTTE